MNRISFRQEDEKQVIHNLKSYQVVHDKLLDQLFSELGARFHNREISDRFWDAIPSDLRSKYQSHISSLRGKIRDIISQYPSYYGNYKQQNKPYFQKMDKQKKQREEMLKSMGEQPFEHEMAEVGA